MDKRIYLCLAHMSGNEMKYIQEAFDTNWVVPLGPNVNAFEEELKRFIASTDCSSRRGECDRDKQRMEDYPQSIAPHENDSEKLWIHVP